MYRSSFDHDKTPSKLKCPDNDDDGLPHRNPTNLELIDLRAALLFNDTRLLAFDTKGKIVFIDKDGDELETMANPNQHRWDWNIKLCHPVFKNMFWLGCDNASVQVDSNNHNLKLVIADDESRPLSFDEDLRPAIMMVEPWSGHLHVFNHQLPATEERWLKICDVLGTIILIPPSSSLLRDPDVIPVTLTSLAFCTRDPNLTFNKKVKRFSDAIGKAVLNDVIPQHTDIQTTD